MNSLRPARTEIAALRLPDAVQKQIHDLARALDTASTVEDVEREGALQLSSIFGLETAKRLHSADIENLYISFDGAVRARRRKLVDQS
jgi:hypothetical protein